MPSHNGSLGRLGRAGRQAGHGPAMKQHQNPSGNTGRTVDLQLVSGADAGAAPATTRPTSVNADALLSLFECPVCFDYATPPLLQCQSGHMVCSRCREKLSLCPTCRASIGHIRNLAMEKVALTVSFPCRWVGEGCEASLACSSKLAHEEVCELRPYGCCCPGASCGWTGILNDVIPHLLDSHKSITTLQGNDIVFLATDISLPGAVDWVMLQSCFEEHFMLVLEKQEKSDGSVIFCAVVQCVGTRQDAQKFAYRLELGDSVRYRRLTWEAIPKSIHEGISSAFNDCLMFNANVAQLFADSGNLAINVTIRVIG